MLRYASPNERRTISREDLGFYHAVVVSATYEFDNALDVTAPTSFHAPIAHCIAQHPFLSVLVKDRHTDKAYYQRAPHVDLSQHLAILPPVVDTAKQSAIQALLASELDRPFDHAIPPWRVLVTPLINTPLRDTPGETTSCILTFSFSHSILDGPSGISFHRTFLSALNTPLPTPLPAPKVPASTLPLPPPFDTPSTLPISPSFLLSPLLGAILPSFLTSRLNIAPQAVVLSEKTWTGTPCAFVPGTTRSKVAVRVIDAETVARALATARGRGVKLTGVMHALVGRGLRAALGDEGAELVAVTAVDLRAAVGRAAGEMGEFAAGEYTAFPPSGGEAGGLTEGEWEGAGRVTGQLGEARGRLRDQAVGLLRFLPSVRGWLRGKVGGRRDCSYEVSNLGGVDFGEGRGGRVVEAVFAQPGMVVSCPVCVNVVSVKGWRLVYTVTWATGALGVGEDEEDAFVERVYEVVDDGFRGL